MQKKELRKIEIDRIYLGDCLELIKSMPDKSVDCIITDPPYGINYQSSRKIDKNKRTPKILNDKAPYTIWTDEAFRVMKDNSGLLCFTRWDTEQYFREALSKSGFTCKQQIIWDKEIHGMGDLAGGFALQHENLIFAHKGRFIFKGKRPKSVFRSQRVNPMQLKHPNEKPIDLIEKLICSITIENDLVFDPFMGSGTTAVGCINIKRHFIGFELDPDYFRLANNRINKLKSGFISSQLPACGKRVAGPR